MSNRPRYSVTVLSKPRNTTESSAPGEWIEIGSHHIARWRPKPGTRTDILAEPTGNSALVDFATLAVSGRAPSHFVHFGPGFVAQPLITVVRWRPDDDDDGATKNEEKELPVLLYFLRVDKEDEDMVRAALARDDLPVTYSKITRQLRRKLGPAPHDRNRCRSEEKEEEEEDEEQRKRQEKKRRRWQRLQEARARHRQQQQQQPPVTTRDQPTEPPTPPVSPPSTPAKRACHRTCCPSPTKEIGIEMWRCSLGCIIPLHAPGCVRWMKKKTWRNPEQCWTPDCLGQLRAPGVQEVAAVEEEAPSPPLEQTPIPPIGDSKQGDKQPPPPAAAARVWKWNVHAALFRPSAEQQQNVEVIIPFSGATVQPLPPPPPLQTTNAPAVTPTNMNRGPVRRRMAGGKRGIVLSLDAFRKHRAM
jgi:hypothetical protein